MPALPARQLAGVCSRYRTTFPGPRAGGSPPARPGRSPRRPAWRWPAWRRPPRRRRSRRGAGSAQHWPRLRTSTAPLPGAADQPSGNAQQHQPPPLEPPAARRRWSVHAGKRPGQGGAPGRDRTYDLGIRSPLLYPLSYERMSSDRLPLAVEDPLVGSQIDAPRTAFIAVRHKRVPLVRGAVRSGWRQDHASGRSGHLSLSTALTASCNAVTAWLTSSGCGRPAAAAQQPGNGEVGTVALRRQQCSRHRQPPRRSSGAGVVLPLRKPAVAVLQPGGATAGLVVRDRLHGGAGA